MHHVSRTPRWQENSICRKLIGLHWIKEEGNEQLPRMERAVRATQRALARRGKAAPKATKLPVQQPTRLAAAAIQRCKGYSEGKGFPFLEAKHTLHSQADSGPCSALRAWD